jgi:hypothetical protein
MEHIIKGFGNQSFLQNNFFLCQIKMCVARNKIRKRNSLGSPKCSLCDNNEIANHGIFSCGFAKVIF